jgi:dihydrofolate reductase
MEMDMRKLISAFKTSIDAKIEGPDNFADWVEAWSEDFGLTPDLDACVLGGGMYPGYEAYWSAIQEEPHKPHPLTGTMPTSAEVEWARFAAQTPHYVLSNTLESVQWSNTTFLRSLDELADLKKQPGKDIYLMGGARITNSALEAGLLDELRIIVFPLIAGPGKALFETAENRHQLDLRKVEQLPDGRVSMTYEIG